ncbi:hypothetical protein FKM82_014716 [Ascaphus truei]
MYRLFTEEGYLSDQRALLGCLHFNTIWSLSIATLPHNIITVCLAGHYYIILPCFPIIIIQKYSYSTLQYTFVAPEYILL